MSKNKAKETELIELGKKLNKSQSKDALVKLLLQASTLLAELEQSPPQSTHTAMKGCSSALVSPSLLRHKDKEVGLLVAICISEIMRIVAPDAPYNDDTLKEIFQLIVTNFKGLDDVNSPSFSRRVNILETVAKVRSCVVMLDLECDDLILEMFETFFGTASDEQPHNVFVAMRNVLTLVLEESEKIPAAMVEVILKNLLKQKKEGSAARKLAIAVVEKCADKLEPYVRSFLTSVMVEGKSLESGLHKDHHEIVFELYCCAPQLLSGVIPHINDELVKDKLNVRLKAVALLGRLFALPGRQFAQEYPLVFAEFLKRFSDKVVDVRVAVVKCAKAFVQANSTGEQAIEVLGSLQDRLLDYDDKVRVAVVKAICDLAKSDLKSIPTDLLRKVAERLRDKKVVVRKASLSKVMELYRSYCSKCVEGSIVVDKEYEWIPGKIFRCCNDKEIHGLETVLTEPLFPDVVPVEEQSKHLVVAYSTYDENEKKALQYILLQKQRLQQEVQLYLTTRQKVKEDESQDAEKKLQAVFKVVANHFVEAAKAEDNLQKLHQMKDEGIFNALSTLLSPGTSFAEAAIVRGELLKKLGEEHPQYDFMKSLAAKCGYFLISREHVQAATKEVIVYKDSENDKDLVEPSLQLLVEIAVYCPDLMSDAEEDLLTLLKDSDDSIKEGVVHIMSKSGAAFRNKGAATEGRSNVNLILEQLCVEGNRKQAKYAVSAIAAMTADSGLKALSVLYGRLVDKLEDNSHLPTVLQSLGCIAQNAMPIFETREDDIIKFVVRNVLRRPSPQEPEFVSDGDTPSDHVLLKIYALKALVKSFLPKMNAHQRTRLPGLLKVLVKILACGEIADDLNTSLADKGHLRLAAAKGVLRLARRWDSQIPIDVFHMVVMTVQDTAAHVRRALLKKIHHYLRDRTLNMKYASAYALCTVDTVQEIALEARQFMSEYVDDYRKEAHRIMTGQAERTTITMLPEYALVYLVHVLAHHPNYPVASEGVQPEPSAYEPFYRELLFFLRALILQEGDAKGDAADTVPLILAILRTIKGCENVVDKTKTETLYGVCDIAILITKDIAQQKKKYVETYPGVIPLPASVYKVCESKVSESVAKAAEPTAVVSNPPASMTSEAKAAEASAPETKEVDADASKVAESNDPKVTEVTAPATDAKAVEDAKIDDTKMAEANDAKTDEVEGSKTGEADDSKVDEVEDLKMADAEDTETAAAEVEKTTGAEDTKTAEAEVSKTADTEVVKTAEVEVAKTVEPADDKTVEVEDTKMAEAGDFESAKAVDPESSEANGSKAAESNESKVPASDDITAPSANGTDALEPEKFAAPDAAEAQSSKESPATDSLSKDEESAEATPAVVADEKSTSPEVKKSVDGPSKVDGSHLPPCFTDKDVLARFKNVLGKSDKPASPRGRKRAKRVDNGDTISDNTEAELEHNEPTPKKGKVENEKRGKGGVGSGTGLIIKGPSRGGRKSVDKNESLKKAGKKVEVEKEGEEELDENTPSKRKRGRPKGSGKKEEIVSGDEMAGPSSESTPTTSGKKGKPAVSDARPSTESGKKRGRPAKVKEEPVQEKSGLKKDKVATPDKSAKKAGALEKGASPAWKSEGERGGDESLVGCGIKVWWPLDKKFYKGEVVEYDAKKKKHKILYNDGEQEVLNLAKERWEATGKAKTPSAKKEKTPTATPPPVVSGTKYPEPKKLKVTAKTPSESAKTLDALKEGASEKKSAKSASAGKGGKEAEKSAKASKAVAVDKEEAANAFEFDDEGEEELTAKKQKRGSGGKQSKAEKAVSTSKDSTRESEKDTSEGKVEKEGKDVEQADEEMEEPLVAGEVENEEREEVNTSE